MKEFEHAQSLHDKMMQKQMFLQEMFEAKRYQYEKSEDERRQRKRRMDAQRELVNTIGQKSRARVVQKKSEEGKYLREVRAQLFCRDRQVPQEVYEAKLAQENKIRVAMLLNKFMIRAQVPNFITLFKMMDEDSSGLICFSEFQKVVRQHLQVPKVGPTPKTGLSDEELTAVWCAIDDDQSGHINAGEFGAFLRLGDSVHDKNRREKVQALEAVKTEKTQAVRNERRDNREQIKARREADAKERTEATARLAMEKKLSLKKIRDTQREQMRRQKEADEERIRIQALDLRLKIEAANRDSLQAATEAQKLAKRMQTASKDTSQMFSKVETTLGTLRDIQFQMRSVRTPSH